MKDQLQEKYEQVKTHVRQRRAIYISAGAGVVVGAAGAALLYKTATVLNVRQVQILPYKSTQTVEVYVEALGDPGNIVQDTTTGIIYASQGQAARELQLSPSELSKHMRGRNNHVKGHVFELLGKAAVPSE